ncbi:LamG domain-containing protein [Actinoplanes sp. NBRC 101535]|uniref:LamG domain-containing protein n=1 Tax=Actinoplanes sp. NBRC 101535 TaxID=3032196 RepID=UPI002556ABC4|nr:LamG domain-containing protein [Actinoplanes sp. NBRC 101535]
MRSWWAVVPLALAMLAVPAEARADAPAVITHYGFDTPAGTMLEATGGARMLRIRSSSGGRVQAVPHGTGWALGFPGPCRGPHCPHVVLQSPSSADLNPGANDLAYGADVLLAPDRTSPGQNILQKGYSALGSQYKLQIDGLGGRPSCVLADVSGPSVIWIARSRIGVADGRWHRIFCRRTGVLLMVVVDRAPRGWALVPPGLSVNNNRPLSIGAKGAGPNNDQFNGVLDNIWVRIGQPLSAWSRTASSVSPDNSHANTPASDRSRA